MSSTWRYKIYLVLFLIVLSAYALMPSILGLQTRIEQAEAQSKPLNAWEKVASSILPKRQLNLGLDLRGGIYLELDVSVHEAISTRLDVMASQIGRYLAEKKVALVSIERVPQTNRIRAILSDDVALKAFQDYIQKDYSDMLTQQDQGLELVYASENKDEAALQALVKELDEKLKPLGVLEVERSSASDIFRIILKSTASKSEIEQKLAAEFSSLKLQPEIGKVFYQPKEAFLQRLQEETVKQAVETIRNRIDRYGVTEPSIRKLGDTRIAVELPGVSDPSRAISIVKQAGKLEFKFVDVDKNESEVRALVATARKEQNIPEGYNEEIVKQLNEALKGKIPSEDELAFRLEFDPVSKKVVSGFPYLLKKKADVTGDMLRHAQANVGEKGPYVALSFNPAGAKTFAEITAANIGKSFAIVLDGNVNSAPVIQSAIPNGEAQITLGNSGDYNAQLAEAEALALVLREGALPASLKEVTKTVIGPSLGKNAIQEGLLASLVAGLVVVLFMIIYYKTSGFLADVVLAVNVLFILGILAMFQATLTLPGIAGIALTMAMALDANIIIFERIREEIKSGKPVKAAVSLGFSNAFSAVVDTHLTTFISGIVLYQFGSGPIRGFAVTLMIGVVTTLITAYWLTHLIFDYWVQKKNPQSLSI